MKKLWLLGCAGVAVLGLMLALEFVLRFHRLMGAPRTRRLTPPLGGGRSRA